METFNKVYLDLPEEERLLRENFDNVVNMEFFNRSRSWMQEYNRLMSYYRCALMEIETKLNVLNEEFSLRYDRNPISDVKSRLKQVSSVKEKLERRGFPLTLDSIQENLNDVAGIRVICPFLKDVYTIADALLSQDDIVLIERKDYIKKPKGNGYRSLHLILSVPIFLAKEKRRMKVEVQLRTIAMDFWATLEHQLNYKKDFAITDDMMQELYLCAEFSAQLDERMDRLRSMIPEVSLDE